MKKASIFLAVVFFINASVLGQTVYNPSFLSTDEASLTIDKIELGSYNTIIYCTHKSPDYYNKGGWVRIQPEIILKDSYGNRRYKLLKAEGIPLYPDKFNYSYSGQTLSFRLIFPKLASDIKRIDMIECVNDKNCFNVYGLKIRDNSPSYTDPAERSGRKFLRDKIREWGQCKNVAMTLTGGDVALYGTNGWAAAEGTPQDMTEKLSELNQSDKLIDDIVLTENGNWLILWGNNGISSYGTPPGLFAKLEKWNNEGEVITSVTFNDNGDWIAITKKKFAASSDKVIKYIKEGENKYGEFWAAHLTNDGLVLCFERGYQFFGNVPANLKNKLQETKINVFRIKFLSDGSYFIADFNGKYDYYM
jgi:hypothetical protein